jgi:osmotically-inducible protein OsmY
MKSILALASTLALALSGPLAGCAGQPACTKPECAKDAAITADVRARFKDYPALQPPNQLSVQTVDKVVYLSGVVDTEFERRLAESVAEQADGVTHVVNNLGVSNNSR